MDRSYARLKALAPHEVSFDSDRNHGRSGIWRAGKAALVVVVAAVQYQTALGWLSNPVKDLGRYQYIYDQAALCKCNPALEEPSPWSEFLWDGMLLLFAQWTLSFELWLFLVVLTASALSATVIWRMQSIFAVPQRVAVAVWSATFLLMNMWPFYSSGLINVLRSGVAIPLVLLGFLMLIEGRKALPILCFVAALGTQMPVASTMIVGGLVGLALSARVMALLVGLLSALYAFGITPSIGRRIPMLEVENAIASYVYSTDYRAGVRLDFLVFSIALLTVAIYVARRAGYPGRSVIVLRLISGLFLPFLVLGYIEFSDRLLQGLWIAAPVATCILLLQNLRSMWLYAVCTFVPLAAVVFWLVQTR